MDGRKTGQWSVSVKICSISRTGAHPLALPLGELSPKVTERVLHPVFPSPASLRSAAAPIGRGKGGSSCSRLARRVLPSLATQPFKKLLISPYIDKF